MSDNPHSPGPQQPPPQQQGAAKRSKSTPILLGIAAVVTVVLIAGGSFAFFSGFNPFSAPEPDYAQTPSQSDVMDFSGLSTDMHLRGAPMSRSADATDASPQVLRFIGSTASILTRVGEGDEPS